VDQAYAIPEIANLWLKVALPRRRADPRLDYFRYLA
jgi:hypothetical protein